MFDGSTGGGDGYGGDIMLSVHGGSIDVTGDVNFYAQGSGGDYLGEGTPVTAQGGGGYGGYATIFSGGPGSIIIDGYTLLAADGVGGDGQTGGSGYGGNAGVYGYDGTITLGSFIDIFAFGVGGNASSGFGGIGGYGQGGTAYIEALGYGNPKARIPRSRSPAAVRSWTPGAWVAAAVQAMAIISPLEPAATARAALTRVNRALAGSLPHLQARAHR